MSIGIFAKAMATESNAICVVHRDKRTGEIVHIRASKVGENGVEPGKWYSLDASGEFIEAE